MKNCNKCVYFENRKKKDLYMWVANVPDGPSVKFLVLNGKVVNDSYLFILPQRMRVLAWNGILSSSVEYEFSF